MYNHRNTFTLKQVLETLIRIFLDFNAFFARSDGMVMREVPILSSELLTLVTEESGSADFYLISFLGSTYRAKNVEL